MIGTLARKRTNLVAVAALLALVAALFIGLQSTSAAASVVVSSNDSDDTIKAGSTVTLSGYIKEPATGAGYTGHSLQATGSSPLIVTPTAGFATATITTAGDNDAPPATPTVLGTVYVPEGTPDGKYNVQVLADSDETPVKYAAGQFTLTVGDPGKGVGSAAITFGYTNAAGDQISAATATGAKQDTDTAAQGAEILLQLQVNNTLGNKTNNGDVQSITIIATGGQLSGTDATVTSGSALPDATVSGATTYTSTAANAVTTFTASRATAGKVEVSAIVAGADGSQATAPVITLKFSGPAASIELGDVSGSLDDGATAAADGVYFDVSALDAGGTASTLSAIDAITVTVSKAPTGGATGDLDTAVALGSAARTTAALGALRVAVDIDDTNTPTAGEYTVDVTLGTNARTKKSATVVVVGDADSIAISADMTEATFGDIVTFTATVKDKNGNPVANTDTAAGATDGVTFTWAGNGLKAQSLNTTSNITSGNRPIKNGEATAQFVVASRSGDALVIASIGSKRANVALSAPASEDAAPAEASLDCFSSLSGFSTWTCGVDSTASEAFALISGRGATALQLWNGSAWVRYAVVNGNEVPGSSDFMITEDDILYISN